MDSDIAKRIRGKVIKYVQHKYGENAVCGILTKNAQAPRGAIRIAAKYYGLMQADEFVGEMQKIVDSSEELSGDRVQTGKFFEVLFANNKIASTIVKQYLKKLRQTRDAFYNNFILQDGALEMDRDKQELFKILREAATEYFVYLNLGDTLAKKVPVEPGVSFDMQVGDSTLYEEMLQEVSGDSVAENILKWAKSIEGSFTSYGAHAAGIVISDNDDVKEYVPLRWNEKLDEWTTQVDMNHVEAKGLLKMDMLGLKTLDIITDCLRMVEKRMGISIDPLRDIPMDDEAVFREIFQTGRTNSVFQFESAGMKKMLKSFRPDTFEDLVILVSMFRPGPLQYLSDVIDIKNGRKPIEFITPELKPILGKTYGATVYQEQVMQIFQQLAGYTLGGADQVRRYMSKKKMDKLVHEEQAFIYGDEERGIDGCVKRGIDEVAAKKLFDQMTDFAKYA